jgi:hypothetical protein
MIIAYVRSHKNKVNRLTPLAVTCPCAKAAIREVLDGQQLPGPRAGRILDGRERAAKNLNPLRNTSKNPKQGEQRFVLGICEIHFFCRQ